MARIDIEAVRHGFAGRRAIDDVHLAVGDGEIVALLGPSGCGKSTLLRLCAGLDRPDSGRIVLDGRPVTGPGPDRCMVFQTPSLYPWLSVRDNVAFGLAERGVGAADRRRAAEVWLQRVGLTAQAAARPATLSGGMQQRAALARALAVEPQVLLLDEPFGALDMQTRVLMQELLEELWQRRPTTVLLVTHDVDEAIYLGARVAVMSGSPGSIIADLPVPLARPRSFADRSSPAFVALRQRLGELVRAQVMAARGAA